MGKEARPSFLKKRSKKLLTPLSLIFPVSRRQGVKVFWSFFSKKDYLPFLLLFVTLQAIAQPAPRNELPAEAAQRSAGCITCHTASDAPTMHRAQSVVLGCADCHGGNPAVPRPDGTGMRFGASQASPDGLAGHAPAVVRNPGPAYLRAMLAAHVQPLHPEAWNVGRTAPSRSAATPR